MGIKIDILALIWYPWLTYTIWEIATNIKIAIDNQQTIVRNQNKILEALTVDGEK